MINRKLSPFMIQMIYRYPSQIFNLDVNYVDVENLRKISLNSKQCNDNNIEQVNENYKRKN